MLAFPLSLTNFGVLMRRAFALPALAASALVMIALLIPSPAAAQQPRPAQAPPPARTQTPPPQPPQPAPAGPYKAIAITPAAAFNDPSLETFRGQIAEIAKSKDRAALAKLIARNFFWERADGKPAPKKPGIDNLTAALGLAAPDGSGWEALAAYAADPTAEPFPDRKGVVCSPAGPTFNEQEMQQVAAATQTDVPDWAYPAQAGVEVREKPDANSPVVDKLDLVFVRLLFDDPGSAQNQPGAADDWGKVVTPGGKIGFVQIDALVPLANDQICYVKQGNTWRIAGYLGGGE
jgi:hypothetical protein